MSDLYRQPLPFKRWKLGRTGADALTSTYWRQYIKSDPNMTNLTTTIEIVFAPDQRVFAATEPINSVSSSTGRAYQYAPILQSEPEISSSIEIGSSTSKARSFSIQIPNTFVDAAKLIRSGRYLSGFAEVSLQFDGCDYDQRIVLMRGEMDSGVTFYPAEGGIIEFSITDPKESSDYPCPPYTVDNSIGGSFPNAPDDSNGARYPLILGEYGLAPCPWVSGTTTEAIVMISYGNTEMQGDVVYIDGEPYTEVDATYGWETHSGVDADGVSFTGIKFNIPASFGDFTENVYVPTAAGNTTSTNPIDQIKYLVSGFTGLDEGTINQTLFSKARSRSIALNSNAIINAGGDNNASALSFIESTMGESFPMICMVWEGNGYGPVIIDREAPVSYELNVEQWPVLGRTSGVTESAKNKVSNDFQLHYKYNAMEDRYSGMVVRNYTNNIMCNISASNCGIRQRSPVSSPYIHDDLTAASVVDWLTAHLSQPHILVSYKCYGIMYLKVTTGDNVKITDPEFGWSSVVATVVGIQYHQGVCSLDLCVWQTYFGISGGATGGNLRSSGGPNGQIGGN